MTARNPPDSTPQDRGTRTRQGASCASGVLTGLATSTVGTRYPHLRWFANPPPYPVACSELRSPQNAYFDQPGADGAGHVRPRWSARGRRLCRQLCRHAAVNFAVSSAIATKTRPPVQPGMPILSVAPRPLASSKEQPRGSEITKHSPSRNWRTRSPASFSSPLTAVWMLSIGRPNQSPYALSVPNRTGLG